MKRVYVAPQVNEERFEANESVAACIEATAKCTKPQDSKAHGICMNGGTVTFTTTGATGYEKDSHGFCKNRPISDMTFYNAATGQEVAIGNLSAGVTYNGYWTSKDYENGGGDPYKHYGTITVKLIDTSRPLHS